MHSTNYHDTLITVASDCPTEDSVVPGNPDSIAGLQYAMLVAAPYTLSSDDLLFAVHAARKGVVEADSDAARIDFFSKPQACLRASPLVKSFGWGLHHDGEGRVALVDQRSDAYAALVANDAVTKRPGMRSKRA